MLWKKNNLTPDNVQKIVARVASHEATVVDNREIPDICLQHMLAVMLIDKTASFRAAHDVARMKDANILKQRAKVTLVGDASLDKLLPKRAAVVEVTTMDGKTVSERVETVRGTSGNPMTREEMIAKGRDLCVPILGAEKYSRLVEKIFALETVKSITELRPLIQV